MHVSIGVLYVSVNIYINSVYPPSGSILGPFCGLSLYTRIYYACAHERWSFQIMTQIRSLFPKFSLTYQTRNCRHIYFLEDSAVWYGYNYRSGTTYVCVNNHILETFSSENVKTRNCHITCLFFKIFEKEFTVWLQWFRQNSLYQRSQALLQKWTP